MKKLALILPIILAGCTNDPSTIRTLQSSGYSNIKTTGWAIGCSDRDTFSTGFTATNPAGKRVSGVVCCGLVLKGCTVRF